MLRFIQEQMTRVERALEGADTRKNRLEREQAERREEVMLTIFMDTMRQLVAFDEKPEKIDWRNPRFDHELNTMSFATQFSSGEGKLNYRFARTDRPAHEVLSIETIYGRGVITKNFKHDPTLRYGPQTEDLKIKIYAEISFANRDQVKNQGWAWESEQGVWTQSISSTREALKAADTLSAISRATKYAARIVSRDGIAVNEKTVFDVERPLEALGYGPLLDFDTLTHATKVPKEPSRDLNAFEM